MFVCIPAASTPGKVWACRVREYTHAMVHIEFLDTLHNTTMHTRYFDEGAAAHVCMYYRHTHIEWKSPCPVLLEWYGGFRVWEYMISHSRGILKCHATHVKVTAPSAPCPQVSGSGCTRQIRRPANNRESVWGWGIAAEVGYGVAMISRLLRMTGLFCRILSLL